MVDCLKCDKLFTPTEEFSLTPENNFNFLSFNFCDDCRNLVNINDFPIDLAGWMVAWYKDYFKMMEKIKGRD